MDVKQSRGVGPRLRDVGEDEQGYIPNPPSTSDHSHLPQARDFASNPTHASNLRPSATFPVLRSLHEYCPTFRAHQQPPSNPNGVNHSYRQGPTASDSQTRYLQELVARLQNINEAQAKQIVELKIGTAVLERDLEHASQARNSINSSLGVVIGALTAANSLSFPVIQPTSSSLQPGSSPPPLNTVDDLTVAKLKEAEHEIEILRLKNQHLNKELKLKHVQRSSEHIPLPLAPELPLAKIEVEDDRNVAGKSEVSPVGHESIPQTEQVRPVETITSVFPGNPANNASYAKVKSTPSPPVGADLYREVETNLPTLDELVDDSDDYSEEALQRRQEREAYYNPAIPAVLRASSRATDSFGGNVNTVNRGGKNFWAGKYDGLRPEGHLFNEYAIPTMYQQDRHQIGQNHGPNGFDHVELEEELQNNPFTSVGELRLAIDINGRESRGDKSERLRPGVFEHGLQYRPPRDTGNVFRTVIISNFPKDVQLANILTRVRGGSIMAATLCDTFTITGGMTVYLHFKREEAAMEFTDFYAQNSVLFDDITQNSYTADVALLKSPTYPSHHRLMAQSRCIFIPLFPNSISIQGLMVDIARNNKMRSDGLLSIWMDEDRSLHLEFSSVQLAGSSFGIILSYERYRYARVQPRWDLDPCSGSCAELLAGSFVKKPLFPNKELEAEYSEERFGRYYDEERQRNEARRRAERVHFAGQDHYSHRKLKSYKDMDAARGKDVVLSYDGDSEDDQQEEHLKRDEAFAISEDKTATSGLNVSVVNTNDQNREARDMVRFISKDVKGFSSTTTCSLDDRSNDEQDAALKGPGTASYGREKPMACQSSDIRRQPTSTLGSKYVSLVPSIKDQTITPRNGAAAKLFRFVQSQDSREGEISETSAIAASSEVVSSDITAPRRISKRVIHPRPRPVFQSLSSPFAIFHQMYGKSNTVENDKPCQELGVSSTPQPLAVETERLSDSGTDPVTPEPRKRQRRRSIEHDEPNPVPSSARTIIHRLSTPKTSSRPGADSSIFAPSAKILIESKSLNPDEIALDLDSDEEEGQVKEVVAPLTPKSCHAPSGRQIKTPTPDKRATVMDDLSDMASSSFDKSELDSGRELTLPETPQAKK